MSSNPSRKRRGAEQFAPYDEALNARCSVNDGHHPAIAPAPLDAGLAGETLRAHAIHRDVAYLDGSLSGEIFRHRDLSRIPPPGIKRSKRTKREQPSGLQLRGCLSERRLNRLKFGKRTAKGESLLRIGDCGI